MGVGKEKWHSQGWSVSPLRVLSVVWRGEITFCPNPEDPFSSSILVLSWSGLSSCHWKFDPAEAVWSLGVPYLTARPFLVLWQVNILLVLSVWERIPDGHSPYVFTSDWHSEWHHQGPPRTLNGRFTASSYTAIPASPNCQEAVPPITPRIFLN